MNGQPFEIRPHHVVICDDVRTEDNGKLILIGVYTDTISAAEFPVVVSFSFYVEFEATGQGEQKCEFRVVLQPDDIEVAKIAGTIGARKAGHGSFSFGGVMFQLQRPGYLAVQFRGEGRDWIDLTRRQIIKVPNPPTAFSPPSLQSSTVPPALT